MPMIPLFNSLWQGMGILGTKTVNLDIGECKCLCCKYIQVKIIRNHQFREALNKDSVGLKWRFRHIKKRINHDQVMQLRRGSAFNLNAYKNKEI